METRLIKKEKLAGIIGKIAENLPVFAPVKVEDNVLFKQLDKGQAEGFQRNNTLAGYIHLHWARTPQAPAAQPSGRSVGRSSGSGGRGGQASSGRGSGGGRRGGSRSGAKASGQPARAGSGAGASGGAPSRSGGAAAFSASAGRTGRRRSR